MTDHRAAAEEHLGHARAADPADELGHLQYALVHATLAGPPARTVEIVADQSASRELEKLRRAVRGVLSHVKRLGPDDVSIPQSDIDALGQMVEGAS